MKLFISIPMNKREESDVKEEMQTIVKSLQEGRSENIELIDTFYNDMPDDATGYDFIARSIADLGKADLVYFAKNWEINRGCIIEFLTAISYGKEYITYNGGRFNNQVVIDKLPENIRITDII